MVNVSTPISLSLMPAQMPDEPPPTMRIVGVDIILLAL